MTAKDKNTESPKTEKKDAPKRRVSRIAPLQEKVVALLQKSAASVKDMAEKFDVSERDVRLAIDRARNGGENIKRVSKGTFGYEPLKKAVDDKKAEAA